MNCQTCRERCVSQGGIDPLIAGHKNGRFLESICYACPSFDRETFDNMRYPHNSQPQYVAPTSDQINQVKAELAHIHTDLHALQAKKAKPKSYGFTA